jgi:hypothetical protein
MKGEDKMTKEIWFDMDGTIADLYGVHNWKAQLNASNPAPYTNARPLVNMQVLARTLNKLQRAGYSVNIISWTSKNGSPKYNEKVATAKRKWLARHLKSVDFNRIDIVAYGTPKYEGRNGILFDDEVQNRRTWRGRAYDETEILKVLRSL